MQLVSKIFNLRGPGPPTSQTNRRTDNMRSQDHALHYNASCSKKFWSQKQQTTSYPISQLHWPTVSHNNWKKTMCRPSDRRTETYAGCVRPHVNVKKTAMDVASVISCVATAKKHQHNRIHLDSAKQGSHSNERIKIQDFFRTFSAP